MSTIVQMLRFYVNKNGLDWDLYLPQLTFAYNTSDLPQIGLSPFFLWHGRDAVAPSRIEIPETKGLKLSEYTKKMMRRVTKGQEIVLEHKEELKRYSERMRHARGRKV